MSKNNDFIKTLVPGAIATYNKFKILPSITIAQAILESNWGRSSPQNNIFGIKANSRWKGKTQKLKTKEWDGEKMISVMANFRAYDSIENSILDHGILLTALRYSAVRETTDYKAAAIALQKAGYATDPNYAKKLISIIESYKLYEYDKKKLSAWDKEKAAAKKWVMENGISDGSNPEEVASREMIWVMLRRIGIKG